MNNKNMQEKKALIIGGGMAGLLVARVLADYYGEVVIVERDALPEKPGIRAGVSQAFHPHQILPRGDMQLQKLFPGYVDELLELGAFPTQHMLVHMVNRYGMITFPPDAEKGMTCSRSLLEWVVRRRVQALANVRFLVQQEVIGLVMNGEQTRVTGVQMRSRGQQEVQIQTMSADVVIDASGRSSKLGVWLQGLGYELPESEQVTADIGYSTRYYRIPEHKRNSVATILIEGDPVVQPLGAALATIENDIWIVALTGIDGYYPPMDVKGFEEGLTQLMSPLIAETLADAEALTEPRGFRIPVCVRQHYEQMKRWPEGLLVSGDTLCNFDPVYGQGMTIAALEADVIGTYLQQQGDIHPGCEKEVLVKMQEALNPVWWRNTIEDLRWPGVSYTGNQPVLGLTLLQKYFDVCKKQATRQFQSLMSGGEFNPIFMNYFLMNWLIVAPRNVINSEMLQALLAEEGNSPEVQALRAELPEGDMQRFGMEVEGIVPEFSFS